VGQGGLDAFTRIQDAAGANLKEEEFGDGKVSRVTFSANQPGTYKVVVTTFKGGMTGGFTLTANEENTGGTPPARGPVAATRPNVPPATPPPVQGQLTANAPADKDGKRFKVSSFQADAGKLYRFEMTGQDGLDPYLRLEDAGGKQIKNEDFGDGKVS